MQFSKAQLDSIRDQIVKAAGQPQSVTVDGETYVGRSLSDLIAAYKLARAGSVKKNSGLIFRQFIPPSSVRGLNQ